MLLLLSLLFDFINVVVDQSVPITEQHGNTKQSDETIFTNGVFKV